MRWVLRTENNLSPVTHFLAGWLLANTTSLDRRERALVVCASVIPDVDGLGAIPELLTRNSNHPVLWFSQYHHALHTLLFALIVTAAAFFLAKHRWKTALLVFLSFNLHLFCDLIGARGPDGYQWPIPYLFPFSKALQLAWHHQWTLNAWPNVAITVILLLATLWLAWRKGISPLEFVSKGADKAVVDALRARFSMRNQENSTIR